ncbi:MAG: DNA polymerase/3'-5' exonuclease PolX [Parcubacteria group bacterium ADurb.Bin247]|nr:MAG: DNA polymerase/3'-5' exonuclease PolX [Parcubacteria group bacterium ADurb.Bin247]
MKNQEIAKILYDMADRFSMDGVAFKPYAYRKAADVLVSEKEDIEKVYQRGGLKELESMPGIGKHIALKIEEYIKTGKIKQYELLKRQIPADVEELTKVEGVGTMTVKTLYEKLNVKNIKDLKRAAEEHKIAPLFGFGDKKEQAILEGIGFLSKNEGRVSIVVAITETKRIIDYLKAMPEVDNISIAGSLRRMKETVGDIDILVSSKNSSKVMDYFIKMPGVQKVWGKGKTKTSVRMDRGYNVDLRVVPKSSFGSALQYFTGSKEHNIALRKVAIAKGLKLNEYGVFKGSKKVAGETEQAVYSALGVDWIPPELREGLGELNSKLPNLINYNDIKGDLHCHTNWSGGFNSIEEMARKAMSLGYSYIGITDHTKYLRIENGLDEKRLKEQRKEIDLVNKKLDIKILQGCEANILADGSIDIKDSVLQKLDFVIAGIHSHFKLSRDQMTKRMIKAMSNPYVDIISHPTGRIIGKRAEYEIDLDKILTVAKETDTILEINANPSRLDLNDINIRKAVKAGVKMIINTDAHEERHMDLMNLGVAQARRGWASKTDIVNTKDLTTYFR